MYYNVWVKCPRSPSSCEQKLIPIHFVFINTLTYCSIVVSTVRVWIKTGLHTAYYSVVLNMSYNNITYALLTYCRCSAVVSVWFKRSSVCVLAVRVSVLVSAAIIIIIIISILCAFDIGAMLSLYYCSCRLCCWWTYFELIFSNEIQFHRDVVYIFV